MCRLLLVFVWVGLAFAQEQQEPVKRSTPPRSDSSETQPATDATYSSSRARIIDLSPPKDDAKEHPESAMAIDDVSDVQEFHKWNPMRAMKAVEVGDFYFKRKNYRAALSRYEEALEWKANDAVATFRLAQCQEKVGKAEASQQNYEAYLKILPDGPFAEEARLSLERLKTVAAEPGKDPATSKPKPN